jgi:hypothetical protein
LAPVFVVDRRAVLGRDGCHGTFSLCPSKILNTRLFLQTGSAPAATIAVPPINNSRRVSLVIGVRRGKGAGPERGEKSRPGTGSFHPVAIEAAAEATKLLKPSV